MLTCGRPSCTTLCQLCRRNLTGRSGGEAEGDPFLKKWYFWATHSRLGPMIEAAKTIKRHWDGVLRWFESHIANGLIEGLNSLVQAAKKSEGSRRICEGTLERSATIIADHRYGIMRSCHRGTPAVSGCSTSRSPKP